MKDYFGGYYNQEYAVSPDGKWRIACRANGAWDPQQAKYTLYWDSEWGGKSKGSGKLEFPTSVKDEGGVSHDVELGDYYGAGFSGCEGVTELVVPAGVSMGAPGLFPYTPNLVKVEIYTKTVPEEMITGAPKLKHVVLGNGVQEVGAFAFDGEYPMSTLKISSTVLNVGDGAFGMGVDSIDLDPDNLGLSLKDGALCKGDALIVVETKTSGDFTVPSGIKKIYTGAFANCTKIKNINIGPAVEDVYRCVFGGCALESFTVDPANPLLEVVDGALYSKNNATLVAYPQKRPGASFSVREGTETISGGAFNCAAYLKSVTLPESVTMIEEFAFAESAALTAIDIKGSGELRVGESFAFGTAVTELDFRFRDVFADEEAFANAKALRKVYLGSLELTTREDTGGWIKYGWLFSGSGVTDAYCWGPVNLPGYGMGSPAFGKACTLHLAKDDTDSFEGKTVFTDEYSDYKS